MGSCFLARSKHPAFWRLLSALLFDEILRAGLSLLFGESSGYPTNIDSVMVKFFLQYSNYILVSLLSRAIH